MRANKARGLRVSSSPGHLSLTAFSYFAVGRQAGWRVAAVVAAQRAGVELHVTWHHRCGLDDGVTVDV